MRHQIRVLSSLFLLFLAAGCGGFQPDAWAPEKNGFGYQAGFIEAARQAPNRYVTIAMDKVEFKKPVFIGDIVSFYADTTRIGRTSISVHVTVKGERRCLGQTGQRLVLTEADLTYVAIDEDNKPVPIVDNN